MEIIESNFLLYKDREMLARAILHLASVTRAIIAHLKGQLLKI